MKSTLQIMPCPEDLSVDDAILSQNDIVAGYIHALRSMRLTTTGFEEFMGELNRVYGESDKFDFSYDKSNRVYEYLHEDYKIYVTADIKYSVVSVFAKDRRISQNIWDIYLKYKISAAGIEVYMKSYFMSNGQLDTSHRLFSIEEMNYLTSSYYPYINTNVMFDQFLTGNENILLLVGQPGIGKSKLATMCIKHAYENPNNLPYDKLKDNNTIDEQFVSTVHVKSPDVLISDKFWRDLEESRTDIVLIDDLDYMLTSRDSEVISGDDVKKNMFLNQFLSFTDGIEKNNTKFIITTNQPYGQIDSALLRKGRLFDVLELRSLTLLEALDIWKEQKLCESTFYEIFKSDGITSADLGSEIDKQLNDRISNAQEDYLNEPNISKYRSVIKQKKVGL